MRGFIFKSNQGWMFYLENSGISMPVVGGTEILQEGRDDNRQVFCDVNRKMTSASIISLM